MAGGPIKGITISFRGDTTQLDKSLRQIDKETKGIDNELKKVNNALKFNPTNVDLWKQKQTLLSQKIKETEERLNTLKQAQKQMDDDDSVDKNSEEYRKLQREIIETESKLKTFKGQLKQIGNIKLRVASEQLKQIGANATKAGQAMTPVSKAAGVLAGAIGALAYKAGTWADDLNTLQKQYGINTKELQLYSAAADLVDVDVNTIAKSHVKLTKVMKQASKGNETASEAFDKLGISITNEDGTLRDNDEVWQDAITALGEMEEGTDRDALAMDLFGKSAAELNPLIEDGGETYKNVAETMKKYGLDFVDQETLDKANEFNDKIDTIKMIGTTAFHALGAQLAEVFAPVLERVVEAVGRFAQWFVQLNPVIVAVTGGVALLVAAIAPALLIFGSLASAAGTLMGVLAGISAPVIAVGAAVAALVAIFATAYSQSSQFRKAVNGLVTELASALMPILKMVVQFFKELFDEVVLTARGIANDLAPIIVALTPILVKVAKILGTTLKKAFTVLISVIKVLGATIRALANIFKGTFLTVFAIATSAVSRLKSIFSRVKSALTHPFETAKNIIKGIIDKIKGFFNFSVKTPHIPLPHFAVKPAGWKIGDLVKGKIPSLSVKWYATGGIFDSPNLIGVGEAGPEAVVPLDKLWDKLDNMNGGIVININGADKDKYEIAQEVKKVLIQETNRRRLAWQ